MLIEQRAPGDDLRLVVIDGKVVAAALRKPAEMVGTGKHTRAGAVATQSRRRWAATGGESQIPVDEVTEGTVAKAGCRSTTCSPKVSGCGCAGRRTYIKGAPSTT